MSDVPSSLYKRIHRESGKLANFINQKIIYPTFDGHEKSRSILRETFDIFKKAVLSDSFSMVSNPAVYQKHATMIQGGLAHLYKRVM